MTERRPRARPPATPGSLTVALARATPRLVARLAELEARLAADDASAWPEYLETLSTLTRLVSASAPGSTGELLTTRQMATKLGLSAKTLLKHKATGAIRPALAKGKCLRWNGSEVLR